MAKAKRGLKAALLEDDQAVEVGAEFGRGDGV